MVYDLLDRGLLVSPGCGAGSGLNRAASIPPYEKRNRRAEGSGMTATTESRPFSILITDDDRGCREALRSIVEPEGYRTLLASSGEEALDIVREQGVHLALLDMHMPRL